MKHRILCVDDEPEVLEGFRRVIGQKYELDTALGAKPGLEFLEQNGPYSVVISDMRMPGMNGSEFLSTVRVNWPRTIRVLLTGYADLNEAMSVVNNGKIFRYLLKPCPTDTLEKTIADGITQYEAKVAKIK